MVEASTSGVWRTRTHLLNDNRHACVGAGGSGRTAPLAGWTSAACLIPHSDSSGVGPLMLVRGSTDRSYGWLQLQMYLGCKINGEENKQAF